MFFAFLKEVSSSEFRYKFGVDLLDIIFFDQKR